jgi:Fe2+ transport system protein B
LLVAVAKKSSDFGADTTSIKQTLNYSLTKLLLQTNVNSRLFILKIMTRKEINDLIDSKKKSIQDLKNEISELRKQELLMSDEQQQYYEKQVEVVISRRPKKVEMQLHGFIKWKEIHTDQSTGKDFEIERNMVVRVNGEWV